MAYIDQLEFDTLVCQSKKPYRNRRTAKAASKQIKKCLGSHQRPYKCRVCGKYHLCTVNKPKEEDTDE